MAGDAVRSLGAVFAVAALAALLRRFRLAVELLTAGLVTYYSALGLKNLVGRGRPPALLTDVIVRGPAAHGLGFPSGHAAVSFALTATAVVWRLAPACAECLVSTPFRHHRGTAAQPVIIVTAVLVRSGHILPGG